MILWSGHKQKLEKPRFSVSNIQNNKSKLKYKRAINNKCRWRFKRSRAKWQCRKGNT